MLDWFLAPSPSPSGSQLVDLVCSFSKSLYASFFAFGDDDLRWSLVAAVSCRSRLLPLPLLPYTRPLAMFPFFIGPVYVLDDPWHIETSCFASRGTFYETAILVRPPIVESPFLRNLPPPTLNCTISSFFLHISPSLFALFSITHVINSPPLQSPLIRDVHLNTVINGEWTRFFRIQQMAMISVLSLHTTNGNIKTTRPDYCYKFAIREGGGLVLTARDFGHSDLHASSQLVGRVVGIHRTALQHVVAQILS